MGSHLHRERSDHALDDVQLVDLAFTLVGGTVRVLGRATRARAAARVSLSLARTGNNGWPSTNSPMMQPIAQMSTLLVYIVEPRSSSGARYQRVAT